MRQATTQTLERQRGDFTREFRVLASALVVALPSFASTQSDTASALASATLPFSVGERLTYDIRAGIAGSVGKGTMWIEGPVDVRGTAAYLLRSDFQVRVAWMRGSDRSDSWLDPVRMSALRFEKTERHPFSKGEERVEMFPDRQAWTSAAGRGGDSPTDAPLDELSFIYYVRTLALTGDTVQNVNRHYDADRNPVTVRVTGRQVVKTGAGEFATIVVQMRVKDPRRPDRDGVITLFLSDDHCRIPVRIESAMPVFGTAVFTLESVTRG